MPAPTFFDYWSQRYSAGGHFVTRHLSQRIGAVCAWAAQQAGLSPSQVTLLGSAVFLGGALAFATMPDRPGSTLICVLVFQIAYGLDCADGQLARGTGRTSALGAWLDMACDHVRSIALAGALALWLALHQAAEAGIFAGLIFATGAAVHLHTVTALRQHLKPPTSSRGPFRELATAILDTATVLLMLGALRPFPQLLTAFAIGVGTAQLIMAVLLARARLPRLST